MRTNCVIGLDFGTDSVRAVLVQTNDGKVISSKEHAFKRWADGKYCDASSSQYRQHVLDHIEGMEATIKGVLEASEVEPAGVKGICIDTTGSSPIPVDEEGTALCLKNGFEEDPNAMMVLWKDHTAIKEADEINNLSRSWGGVDFTRYEGGIYSSEWFWAKILHIIREDEKIRNAAFSWVEHCDYMTYLLIGNPPLKSLKRSRCAAGHKSMWHADWGGLPEDKFLSQLDPSFPELKKNLYSETYTSDKAAGTLSPEWAGRLGLSEETMIAVGTFDAHAGAVGAEVEESTLVKVMGTSTCDIIVSPQSVIGDNMVSGICGQVDGSVIPNMVGLEAGQSAFGDVLAWFKDVISWPLDQLDNSIPEQKRSALKESLIEKLSSEAGKLPVTENDPVALDWINGRRTPDANQGLKAAIMSLSLATNAPQIFKALVESICFGSKRIVERFREEGVEIKSVVGVGGVAKKSPYIMQTLADVLNMPIKVANSDQAPALGAAMYAATAAGIFENVSDAIKAMGNGFEQTFTPNSERTNVYEELYKRYCDLGAFVESRTRIE